MRQQLLSRLVGHGWHAYTQISSADVFVARLHRDLLSPYTHLTSQWCGAARPCAWAAGQHVQQQVPASHHALARDIGSIRGNWQQIRAQQPAHYITQQDKQQEATADQQHEPSTPADTAQQQQGSNTEETRGNQQEQPSSSNSDRNSDAADSSSSSKGPPDEALLAEWRTASSQWYSSGLHYILRSHLDNPNLSSWSALYLHKQTFLERLLRPKGASYMTWLLRWIFRQSSDVAVPLLEEAHGDFELEGFKEGTSQAIASVLELYAAADWTSLRQMVSSGLLQSMQKAYHAQQDIADDHDVKVGSVQVTVDKLEIACVHAITQQQLTELDEQRSDQQLTATELESSAVAAADASAAAAAAEGAAAVPYWDVVHVYAEVTWHASFTTPGAGVDDATTPKSGHWVLCRGPVPVNRPVAADADKPWFMLAWM